MAPTDTEKSNAMHEEEQAQMLQAHEKVSGDLLPSPVSAASPRPASSSKPKLSAATIIPVWIVLSSAVIIYNNYLYNTLQFRFPVFLVTWHLTFAVSTTIAFAFLHRRFLWSWLPRAHACSLAFAGIASFAGDTPVDFAARCARHSARYLRARAFRPFVVPLRAPSRVF